MLGVGVDRDPVAAERWFDKAAKHHNPEGEYAMGTLFSITNGHEHDLEKATAYLRQSSEAGYVLAEHSLGLLLVNHPELAQNPGEARSLLEAGASGGLWRSSAVLGVLYRDGRGVQKDSSIAYKWFTIAAAQGGKETEVYLRADLTAARTSLSPEQQREADSSAAHWLAANPHNEIFALKGGSESAFFPINEVYATELAQMNSPKGATIR